MGWTFYNSSGQRLSSAAENISGRSTVKVWCRFTPAGALVSGHYGVASRVDTSTGTRSLVFSTDFANLTYTPTATISNDNGASYAGTANFNTYAVGSITILIRQWSGGTETTLDLPHGQALFGDQ